jgi:hypothetical protein
LAELVDACQEREELANIDSARRLAGLLKHFDLYTKSNGRQRGYVITTKWIEEWASRYGLIHEPE